MISIYFEDHKEDITFTMTNEWLAERDVPVPGFFIDVNENAAKIATDYNLTVFPVIFSINDASEITKYAEGLDAIKALTPEMIEIIKAQIVPIPPVR